MIRSSCFGTIQYPRNGKNAGAHPVANEMLSLSPFQLQFPSLSNKSAKILKTGYNLTVHNNMRRWVSSVNPEVTNWSIRSNGASIHAWVHAAHLPTVQLSWNCIGSSTLRSLVILYVLLRNVDFQVRPNSITNPSGSNFLLLVCFVQGLYRMRWFQARLDPLIINAAADTLSWAIRTLKVGTLLIDCINLACECQSNLNFCLFEPQQSKRRTNNFGSN